MNNLSVVNYSFLVISIDPKNIFDKIEHLLIKQWLFLIKFKSVNISLMLF